MALSIFENKSKTPDEKELSEVLGKNFKLWNELKEFTKKEYSGAEAEWKYSGKNYGWGFRLRDKKRVIVYLTPCDGYFLLSIVFGEKATKEALSSGISKDIKKIIESAKVYAEGRGFRVDMKDRKIIGDIKKLIQIKLSY
ncbi:MAG TPA: DUF3788 domain-containing protein [Ignavibacteria bacterium]